MSKYDVSIVGEPFLKYVGDQINVRQKIHASGLGEESRTEQEIQYLNGSNSWVKLASSVRIDDESRLTRIGFSEEQAKNLVGTGLAQDFVLFNGTSNASNPLERFGVSDNASKVTKANYGTAGVDDFGLQAMPGITSFDVGHNNLGSIRTGTIKIRANSLRQFNILELLYVRLGYTILVEWGHGIYFDNNGEFTQMGQTLIDDTKKGWFAQEETTHLEFFDQINKLKEQYQGNYDSFFCKVRNFDWTFTKEGYYDITLDLVSLGDVVESIKVNNLTDGNIIPKKNLDEAQVNLSDIQNFIYCNLKSDSVLDSQNKKYKDIVKVGVNSTKESYQELERQRSGQSQAPKTPPTYKSYVRLGYFLEWMQQNIIPHYQNGDKTDPMIVINTTDYNYMRNFKGLISTNPNTCVIKNDFPKYYEDNEIIGNTDYTKRGFKDFLGIKEFTQEVDNLKVDRPYTKEESDKQKSQQQNNQSRVDPLISGDFSQSPGARKKTPTPNLKDSLGIIMNIYLNADFINELLSKDEKDIKRFDFFSFIKSICDGINSSLGGVVDLGLVIQDEKICNIIDRNLQSRIGRDGKFLNESDQSPEIKMYGIDYDKQQSNFVTDFSFNTKISKDLATMISIGATANNQSKVELSDFFNNLNKGLTDRFAQKMIDGNSEEKKKKEDKLVCIEGKPVLASKVLNVVDVDKVTAAPSQRVSTARTFESDFEPVENKKESDDNQSLEAYRRLYLDQLVSLFGLKSKNWLPKVYFESADKTISKTNTLLKQYVSKYITTITANLRDRGANVASDMIGFIPIDISITLKGLGGVRIYNQLIADVNFLPDGYPSKVEFIIKGVTHQLQGNQWYTTLQAISKPKGTFINVSLEVIDNRSTTKEDLETDVVDEDVVFFSPVGEVIPIVRFDTGGDGYFGASRGDRVHSGVDYSTEVGDTISAPITGILQASRATTNSKLKGFKIIGSGKYVGYTAFVFYAEPDSSLIGQKVDAGANVATALDLSVDYPENVTDHVHFKLTKGGKVINPETIKYALPTLTSNTNDIINNLGL